MRKYAWIPTIATTWRPSPSRALIWLQSYNEDAQGHKSINHKGFFAYEFSGRLFGNYFS